MENHEHDPSLVADIFSINISRYHSRPAPASYPVSKEIVFTGAESNEKPNHDVCDQGQVSTGILTGHAEDLFQEADKLVQGISRGNHRFIRCSHR